MRNSGYFKDGGVAIFRVLMDAAGGNDNLLSYMKDVLWEGNAKIVELMLSRVKDEPDFFNACCLWGKGGTLAALIHQPERDKILPLLLNCFTDRTQFLLVFEFALRISQENGDWFSLSVQDKKALINRMACFMDHPEFPDDEDLQKWIRKHPLYIALRDHDNLRRNNERKTKSARTVAP
jgi:hypothetical protein